MLMLDKYYKCHFYLVIESVMHAGFQVRITHKGKAEKRRKCIECIHVKPV